MKPILLQIGDFPATAQAQIDAEFDCVTPDMLADQPALTTQLRAILTRSNCHLDTALLDTLPALEIIATFGVGYDGIPVVHAAQRGVVVTHTPDVLNAAVAELAIGLLLALQRRLVAADAFVRAGRWRQGALPLGSGLQGKRVGIVGLGRIGKAIAERLAPFGVALAYYGRHDQRNTWRYVGDLRELATQSDVLIVSAPASADTRHLIDHAVLAALGPQGVLVNIARGALIDEDALIDALQRGELGGAALDVFTNEPHIDERWRTLDNVVLAPHIGSATEETRQAMLDLTLDNLRSWFRDGRALTPVPTP